MAKPHLVDTNLYLKIKKRLIKNSNELLSYRCNISIILIITLILLFLYYKYIEKQNKKSIG